MLVVCYIATTPSSGGEQDMHPKKNKGLPTSQTKTEQTKNVGLHVATTGPVVEFSVPPATGKGTPLYFTTTHLNSKHCGK